jgi:hypothetical protein
MMNHHPTSPSEASQRNAGFLLDFQVRGLNGIDVRKYIKSLDAPFELRKS